MNFQSQPPRTHKQGNAVYPPLVRRGRCRVAVVTLFRTIVALLALVMTVLTIVGQVVPYCSSYSYKKEKTYSVWRETEYKYKKIKFEQEEREDNGAEKFLAVLSAIFSGVSCVLAFVFLALWSSYEMRRRREENAYATARRRAEEMEMLDRANPHQGRGRHHNNDDDNDNDDGAGAAADDARELRMLPRAYLGTTEELYRRERRQQKIDRDVGIAAFSLLIAAAVLSLCTLAMMDTFYVNEVADEIREKRGESAERNAGFSLFIAAIIIGVVAFILLAIPFATGLYLCCPPSLKKVYATQELSRSETDEKDERRAMPQHAYADLDYSHDGGVPVQQHHQQHHQMSNNNNINNNSNNYHPNQGYPQRDARVHGGAAVARPVSPQMAMEPTAFEPLRDEQLTAPRAAADAREVYFSSPQRDAVSQPYVPTMVGTYPEALPGPTSMEHVTMQHVPEHNGGANGAGAFPATQAAWRGSEKSSGGAPSVPQTRAAADTGDSKAEKLFDSPVKKF